jgi:hypothetical protein
MAKQTSRQRKHVSNFNAMGHAKRLMNLRQKGKPLIPDSVLKRLASLNLPPNEWVYNVCLRELMRGM